MSTPHPQKALIDHLVALASYDCKALEERAAELWDVAAPYDRVMPAVDERWSLLKEWKLKECDFATSTKGNEEEYPYFTISHNSQPEEPLFLSNRGSAKELRGPALMAALIERQKTHPDETLYKAIQSIAASKFGSLAIFKKMALDQEMLGLSTLGPLQAMSEPHFDAFTSVLKDKLLNRESFDPVALYQKTEVLQTVEQKIALVIQKKDILSNRKEHAAVELLKLLEALLDIEKKSLLAGTISIEEFALLCENHINNTITHPDLARHRQFSGKLYEKVAPMLKLSPDSTDTIQRIKNLKDALGELKAADPDRTATQAKITTLKI